MKHLMALLCLLSFAHLAAAQTSGDPIAGRVIGDSVTTSSSGLVAQTVTLQLSGGGSTLFHCRIDSGVSVCDGWDDLWLVTCPDVATLIEDDFSNGRTTTHRFCQGTGAAVTGYAVFDGDEGPTITGLQCLSP